MAKGVNALKEWTGKARATIVFDSTVDEFTHNGFFNSVKGRPNIALVATTTDGDVFGGFYTVAVKEQDEDFTDPNMFVFSFESHGRCTTPQRFFVKGEVKDEAFVRFWMDDFNGFVEFGVFGIGGGFWLGDERSESYCWNMSYAFEGLENTTLTGNNNTYWRDPPHHHCSRLIAIQLE